MSLTGSLANLNTPCTSRVGIETWRYVGAYLKRAGNISGPADRYAALRRWSLWRSSATRPDGWVVFVWARQ